MNKGIEVQDHDKQQGRWYDTIDDISDGYHTFKELYRFRLLYNAAFFKALADDISDYQVHKSKLHHDGQPPFGKDDWFIVMAKLPTGQISNHYEMKYWDLFKIPEYHVSFEWDGHTSTDVADRIEAYLTEVKSTLDSTNSPESDNT